MKPTYKTSRKYKCPYCDFSASRGELVDHVDKKHQDLIPENYTAARAVYDFINKKNYGICMICKSKVYTWNDKVNRYRNLCDNPKCKAKVRENALERHIRVYNKPTLLNDPEQQEKMLANRRISGTYTFSDGNKIVYTGKYERNALEFMDTVLNIPSKDIQAPGPVLEYEYNGEIHKWITDIYYIPANLLIEIKDGGSNPNNRSMPSYREKQVAKEVMITNLGKFNYVRLTNNNFAQLLDVLADIKNEALDDIENPKMKIHINEEVGGLPRNGPPEAYIIPYGMNNAFAGSCGFAYTDSEMDKILTIDDNNNILPMSESVFNEKFTHGPILIYIESDIKEKMDSMRKFITECKTNPLVFVEFLLGRKLSKWQEILLSSSFRYYDKEREKNICSLIENATAIDAIEVDHDSNIIYTDGNIKICHSPRGYYAYTSNGFNMSSDYFQDLESLKSSNIISLMQDIYNSNTGGETNV